MEEYINICTQLAGMLNGEGKIDGGVCNITIKRKNIKVNIANKPFNSVAHMFNLEAPDSSGNSLITGEIVLTENEVPNIQKRLIDAGIVISAIHNHWIFDNPKLIYFHIETIINPANFVKTMSSILKELH